MVWGSKHAVAGMLGAVVLGLSGCAYDALKSKVARTPTSVPGDGSAAADTRHPRDGMPSDIEASTAQTGDVWDRLGAQCRYGGLEHPIVRKEMQWFEAQPKVIERASQAAAPYLYFVAEEVERRGMPGEIALLPILESGYQPAIKSPNGAAGLWQFMRDTGTHLSLGKSKWYDGRKDVVASTRAALDYLAELHVRFGGDWLTAVAAYNAGWGNIERAVELNRRRGRPTDFWSLDLTPETRQLVGRTLALAQLLRHPGPVRAAFRPIPDHPYFAELALDKPIDLRQLVRQAGISEDDFKTLNPAFRAWHTGPDVRGLGVLVPIAAADAAHQTLAAIPPSAELPALADETDERRRSARGLITYTVRNGDSIWTIAQRHQVQVADLISLNKLPKTPKLRLGQKLLISGGKMERIAALTHSGTGTAPAAPPARSRWAPAASNDVVHYRVQEGDSLWTISRRFKVTIEQLLSWNNLDHARQLQPGQEILVYSAS
mgnify:CR=1 FL=1